MSMSSSGSSTIHPLNNTYPQSYRSSSSSQQARRGTRTASGNRQRQQRAAPPPVRRTTPPSTPRYAASTSSAPSTPLPVVPPPDEKKRSPVSPAVLRSIFASSRTPFEERSISRVAFFRQVKFVPFSLDGKLTPPRRRFVGFILSCLGISVYAARGRGIRAATGLGLSML